MIDKELLGVCPHCNGVVFRKAEIEFTNGIKIRGPDFLTTETICPHCKKKIKVTIQIKCKTEQIW